MLCTQCGLSFVLSKYHNYLVHTNGKEHRCLYCAKLFSTSELMFDHIIQHDGTTFCFLCKKPSDNYQLLMNHIDIHPELHVYGCKRCKWTTANRITFLDHICNVPYKANCNSEHDSHDSGVESNPCTSQVKQQNIIHSIVQQKQKSQNKEKVNQRNPITSSSKNINNLNVTADIIKNDDGLYYCLACPKFFKSIPGFKYHWNKHSDLPNFPCKIRFLNRRKLQIHNGLDHLRNKKSKKSHGCPVCNNVFKTKYSLAFHSLEHKEGFICSHCSLKMSTKKLIKVHLTIQECCGEILHCRTLSNQHISKAVHRFPCPHCVSRFNTEEYLKKHISSVHKDTTVKHRCSKCDRLIATTRNYARHLRWCHKAENNFKKR